MAYMPHNHHFLWAAATWGGRSELALQAARHMAEHVDPVQMRDPELTTLQHYWLTPVFAAVRFGRWDEVLELPEPPEDLTYPRAIWRYARGMALARSGRPAEAAVELAVLEELAAAPELETVTIWGINSAAQLVGIARQVLRGELAAARGEWEMAVAALEEGVLLEDALRYDEPADWHAPVRLNLAAVLLSAGRPAEAERVLLQNLEHYPKNGWALAGLVASLEAQGKTTEVERAAHRFREAWQDADLELATSRL
jgi:tetratricopeptide (TPR) repeat protein